MTEFFHNFLMQALSKSDNTISLKFDAISEFVKNKNTLLNKKFFNFKLEKKKLDEDIRNLTAKADIIEEKPDVNITEEKVVDALVENKKLIFPRTNMRCRKG